jgi:hypothetical protein
MDHISDHASCSPSAKFQSVVRCAGRLAISSKSLAQDYIFWNMQPSRTGEGRQGGPGCFTFKTSRYVKEPGTRSLVLPSFDPRRHGRNIRKLFTQGEFRFTRRDGRIRSLANMQRHASVIISASLYRLPTPLVIYSGPR